MLAELILLLAASVSAAALPQPVELIRRSLEPSRAFQGNVLVEIASPGGARRKELRVASAPGGRYRRELYPRSGEPNQIAVSDGRVEWVYDRARGKVWKGSPPEPDYKRLGPEEEQELLKSNYRATVSAGEPVARRATWRLELRAKDGGLLRRRLWVDRKEGVVLRSESFRPDGMLSSWMSFTAISFPSAVDSTLFLFTPPAGASVVERSEADYMEQDEAEQAAGFKPRLPARLPPGFVLESLDVLPRGKKRIVHARYSDGMTVLSLFQCPPRVRLDLGRGRKRPARLSTGRGTLSWEDEGTVLSWSAGGSRFALVGDLPEAELIRTAESLR